MLELNAGLNIGYFHFLLYHGGSGSSQLLPNFSKNSTADYSELYKTFGNKTFFDLQSIVI